MEIAVCKYSGHRELLPHILVSRLEHNGMVGYVILLGWWKWAIDIQWTNKLNS